MRKFLSIIFILFTLFPTTVYAQSFDASSLYNISDDKAVDGDIVIYSNQTLIRANEAFSNKMFGVLQSQPLLVFKTAGQSGKPVVRAGATNVNVTNANGSIKKGDYITTSLNPGKGQKASQSGYVLGIALADMNEASGQIPVAIRIEYAELSNPRSVLRAVDDLGLGLFQGIQDPQKSVQVLKYLSAGLVTLISIVLSLLIFARSISKSIEAIGRNPLSQNAIQVSIIINAGLTVAVIVIAVLASYVLVRL